MPWAQLIETTTIGYAFIDNGAQIRLANDAWCALFGMDRRTDRHLDASTVAQR